MNLISSLLAAEKILIGGKDGIGISTISSTDALNNVLTLIYTWTGIIAVLVIIVAGYLFLTARGDPAQIKRGKDAIRGAVIGLIVVIMAFVITQFVMGRL